MTDDELKAMLEDAENWFAESSSDRNVRTLVAEVRRLRATLLAELNGCFCDDRDGNCNPPHAPECSRCLRIREALQ